MVENQLECLIWVRHCCKSVFHILSLTQRDTEAQRDHVLAKCQIKNLSLGSVTLESMSWTYVLPSLSANLGIDTHLTQHGALPLVGA